MTALRRLAVVLVALLVAACAADDPAPAGPTEAVPGAGPSRAPGVDQTTQVRGALGGDATLEGGCAWIDAGGERYEVLWPDGYEVAFDPLRLVGPDGGTVADEGGQVVVTGAPAPDMASICQVGTLFRAETVTAQDGSSD